MNFTHSPYTLCADIFPPCASTLDLAIARPKPYPPVLLLRDSSCRKNLSNILERFSGFIPSPVLYTSMICLFDWLYSLTDISPCSAEYFTALSIKIVRMCFNALSSPLHFMSGCTSTSNFCPFQKPCFQTAVPSSTPSRLNLSPS